MTFGDSSSTHIQISDEIEHQKNIKQLPIFGRQNKSFFEAEIATNRIFFLGGGGKLFAKFDRSLHLQIDQFLLVYCEI